MTHLFPFFVVTLLGFALRALYGLEWHPPSQFSFSDMKANLVNAHQLWNGVQTPVVASRHGLFTLLLAPFFWLPHPLRSMDVLMLLLSCLRLLCIGGLLRWLLAPPLALAVYAWLALSPLEIDAGSWFLDTQLYGTLMLLALALCWRWRQSTPQRSAFWAVAWGFVAGLTILTRENFLPTLALGWLWMVCVRGRVGLRDAGLSLLTAALTLSPMVVRNLQLTGQPFLATSRGAYNLYYFNSGVKLIRIENSRQYLRVMSPLYQLQRFAPGYDLRRLFPLSFDRAEELHTVETHDAAYWRSRFWSTQAQHPGRLLFKGLHLGYLFLVPPWPGAWERELAAWLYPTNLMFTLVVASGLLWRWRRRDFDRVDGLIAVFLVSLLLSTWITFGEARYRTPYDPLLLVFALRRGVRAEGPCPNTEKEEADE